MGFYREQVLPRLVDKMCGVREMDPWRTEATEGLSGTIVELGSGSGLNLPLVPPAVERIYAVEPAALARRMAEKRFDAAPAPVEHVGLEGESIPLADASCDAALCTFTLCTIPDVAQALAEVRRVLRPGGRLHFLEHGIAPDEGVARWQRRVEPVQKKLGGGCHLTRDPVALVRGAGFDVEVRSQRYAKGPKPWSYFTVGTATLTV